MVFFLFKRRTFFMLLGTVVLLLLARTTWRSFAMGLPLIVLGELVRVWSAGSLKKMDKLVTAGPFAICRNPLYVGSYIMTAGYFVMCGRLDAAIVGSILFWVFHAGAIVHEEGMLRERYGEAFDAYCKAVPRVIPRLDLAATRGGFSTTLLKENSEHRAAISSTIVIGLFAIIASLGSVPLELIGDLIG